MRQVVLVVVLVGAAFLGGAFVNGPGLRWVQTQLLGSLGLNEEGEIASVDLKGAVNPGATAEGPRGTKAGAESIVGPQAPVPSIIAEAKSGKEDASGSQSDRVAGGPRSPASPSSSPLSPPPAPPLLTPPLSSPQPAQEPSTGTAGLDAKTLPPLPEMEPPALLDPSVKTAVTSTPDSQTARDRDVAPAVPGTRRVALANLMPSGAPPPTDSPPSAAASASDDWAALSRKMQTLGISRFTIEGQPGGPVVFSCLIPLAGRQAVSQRFEAEGQDAFQAAQATLRRVALWRATQQR